MWQLSQPAGGIPQQQQQQQLAASPPAGPRTTQ